MVIRLVCYSSCRSDSDLAVELTWCGWQRSGLASSRVISHHQDWNLVPSKLSHFLQGVAMLPYADEETSSLLLDRRVSSRSNRGSFFFCGGVFSFVWVKWWWLWVHRVFAISLQYDGWDSLIKILVLKVQYHTYGTVVTPSPNSVKP